MALDDLVEAMVAKGYTRLVFEAEGMAKRHRNSWEAREEIDKLKVEHERQKAFLREGALSIKERAERERKRFLKSMEKLGETNKDLHTQIKDLERRLDE